MSRTDRVKAFIESTYGAYTGSWGVYRNKKTGELMASPKRPCKCAWHIVREGLTESDALSALIPGVAHD